MTRFGAVPATTEARNAHGYSPSPLPSNWRSFKPTIDHPWLCRVQRPTVSCRWSQGDPVSCNGIGAARGGEPSRLARHDDRRADRVDHGAAHRTQQLLALCGSNTALALAMKPWVSTPWA